MESKYFKLILAVLCFFLQGQVYGQQSNTRYSVAASNDNIILVDIQSGESWILVKTPNLTEPYEWMKIKSISTQNQGTKDWTGIVQGQKTIDANKEKQDLIKWHEKELSITNEKIRQLESHLSQFESSQKQLAQEALSVSAKDQMDKALQAWKLALQVLKDHAEHESQIINNLTRL